MKHIIPNPNNPGKWIDKNSGIDFKGNVLKDLVVGDQLEKNGKVMELSEKTVDENGYLIIHAVSVGV